MAWHQRPSIANLVGQSDGIAGTSDSPFIVFAFLVLCEEGAGLALAENIVVRLPLDVGINNDHQLAASDCQLVLHVYRGWKVVLVPCEIPAQTSSSVNDRA